MIANVESALASVDPSRWAGRRVLLAVPDATRPFDPLLLGPLLAKLGRAEVTVLVALGLHRRMTDDELAPLLAVCGDVPVHQHDAASTKDDLSPRVTSADAVICAGIVEPHQYAGFSGGVKTVAIGCASADAIGAMHSLALLRDPRTAIGSIDDNPFQAALWRRTEHLADVWALQVVPSGAAWFGPAREAFQAAVGVAERECFVDLPEPRAWLHLPVPPEKSQSFYQASRAATYVALHPRAAIAPGGALIVEAACPEGIGLGAGERAFAEALARGRATLLDELATGARPLLGGEQRAYVLAKALDRARIVLVGARRMPELAAMGVEQVETLDAVERDPSKGRTIDDVFSVVPRLVR